MGACCDGAHHGALLDGVEHCLYSRVLGWADYLLKCFEPVDLAPQLVQGGADWVAPRHVGSWRAAAGGLYGAGGAGSGAVQIPSPTHVQSQRSVESGIKYRSATTIARSESSPKNLEK